MRIRTKLTLLLVTFAVGPLLVVSLDLAVRTRSLGRELSRSSVDELRRRTAENLERSATQSGRVIQGRLQTVELATSQLAAVVKAAAARDIESAAAPTDVVVESGMLKDDQLFELPAKYFLRSADGAGSVLPVGLSSAVFHPAVGLDSRQRVEEISRLRVVADMVRSTWDATAGAAIFAGVVLPSGSIMVYPAVREAGIPAGIGDSLPVQELSGLRWEGPFRHEATGQWVLRCGERVVTEDGSTLGRVWVDVLMQDLAGEAAASLGTPGVDTEILLVSQNGSGSPADLVAWRRGAAGSSRFSRLEPVSFASIVAGGDGASETDAIEPRPDTMSAVRAAHAGLSTAVLVRADVMQSAANDAEQRVLSQTASQVRFIGVAAGVVFVLALGVAYLAAKTVTRPIRRLADHADRVAKGDYTAEVRVRGSDEIARLSRDIQSMIPRLAATVKQQASSAVAAEIQQAAPKDEAFEVPGFDVASVSEVADRSRGDHAHRLDLSGRPGERVGVVLGDVSGEGIGAALLLASVRAVATHLAPRHVAAGELLTAVNAAACAHASDGRFVAMLLVVFDRVAGQVRWANAGHEPPLVYLPERDAFTRLDGGGLPIAVDPDARYETLSTAMMPAGSVLYLGTDGVWNARNAKGEAFGRERLTAVIASCHDCPAASIAARISTAIADFRGDAALSDDIMFVVLRKQAEPLSM